MVYIFLKNQKKFKKIKNNPLHTPNSKKKKNKHGTDRSETKYLLCSKFD